MCFSGSRYRYCEQGEGRGAYSVATFNGPHSSVPTSNRPTEIKFGETRTGASSSRNFFTITRPAKTANSINTFCRFGMTWQIQVEIILLPFQGRWCYECLLRKTFCCFGMTWQIQVEITLLPIKGRWCYKGLLTKKQRDHKFVNRLILSYETNTQLLESCHYSFFLFATNLPLRKAFYFHHLNFDL